MPLDADRIREAPAAPGFTADERGDGLEIRRREVRDVVARDGAVVAGDREHADPQGRPPAHRALPLDPGGEGDAREHHQQHGETQRPPHAEGQGWSRVADQGPPDHAPSAPEVSERV